MVETWQWSGPLTPLAVTALAVLFGALFALLALWIALPFAVFGIRRHLREIQGALEAIRRTLEDLHRAVAGIPPAGAARADPGDPPPEAAQGEGNPFRDPGTTPGP